MVHFEFGRGGLAQAHLLKAFELLQGAIKGAFVLFSRTLLGLVGFVLHKSHSLAATAAHDRQGRLLFFRVADHERRGRQATVRTEPCIGGWSGCYFSLIYKGYAAIPL